jgi:hypothetical protein
MTVRVRGHERREVAGDRDAAREAGQDIGEVSNGAPPSSSQVTKTEKSTAARRPPSWEPTKRAFL